MSETKITLIDFFKLFATFASAIHVSQGGEFVNLLRDYVEDGVFRDYTSVMSGGQDLLYVRQLLGTAIRDLDKYVI